MFFVLLFGKFTQALNFTKFHDEINQLFDKERPSKVPITEAKGESMNKRKDSKVMDRKLRPKRCIALVSKLVFLYITV